jgi:hypothetical protein
MRYVLDSNIALKWALPEADSDKARLLRVEFQNQIHELLAPNVVSSHGPNKRLWAIHQCHIRPASLIAAAACGRTGLRCSVQWR